MIKKLIIPVLFMLVLSSCGSVQTEEKGVDPETIGKQVALLDENIQKAVAETPAAADGQASVVPRTILEDGTLSVVPAGDWTSGFYPGVLWYMYELTGNEIWKGKAVAYTEILEDQQYNGSNHDVGFRMYCSYGNALRLTGNKEYIPILVQSAKTLIGRYHEPVGCIRSWDFNDSVWQYPVIIDNMMNLELLFWASEQSGDPVYRMIAISHALTTMKHHFREDYSSVHVVDYDTITGEVLQRNTHQGYSDQSAWARGQAWGLYGYTMTYRFTKDDRFLAQADKIAGYLLANLPEDGVPYWDFDAPGIPGEPRDVSAAAIMTSALYELSTYSEKGAVYKSEADRILDNIWANYRSAEGGNFGFILDHSVGNKAGNSEVDVPLNYADYYFLEALIRKNNISQE